MSSKPVPNPEEIEIPKGNFTSIRFWASSLWTQKLLIEHLSADGSPIVPPETLVHSPNNAQPPPKDWLIPKAPIDGTILRLTFLHIPHSDWGPSVDTLSSVREANRDWSSIYMLARESNDIYPNSDWDDSYCGVNFFS